jgi:hypothetical protein
MARELVIKTSQPNWLPKLTRAYKRRKRTLLVDDANVGINPQSETIIDMAKHAKLSPREWASVVTASGIGVVGAWLIVMAVLDPEPYSKVFGAIAAGGFLLSGGGFMAIRILTGHKPPNVRMSPRGFEITWD